MTVDKMTDDKMTEKKMTQKKMIEYRMTVDKAIVFRNVAMSFCKILINSLTLGIVK